MARWWGAGRQRSAPARLPTVCSAAALLLIGCTAEELEPGPRHLADAGTTQAATTPASTDVFRIDSVAPGVWVAEVLARPEAYAFANSLVVAGDAALLVVDTQQSPAAARALIAWIRATFDLPVRWVVNTHFHGDHVNGNGAYRDGWPEVRFVAHASVPEAMRTEGRARMEDERSSLPVTLERRQAWLDSDTLPEGQEMTPELRDRLVYSVRVGRAYLDELEGLEVVEPEVLLNAPRTLDLGGRTVEVMPVGPAHTPGDLVVWIPDVGVAGVGDLLEEAAPWIEGAHLAGWATALERVRGLAPTGVVASHGSAARGPELLDGHAPLFADLVEAAGREAEVFSEDAGAWPTEEAVVRVVEALEAHRPFLASVGVDGDAYEEWARAAARQALVEVGPSPG